ncbi:MAG: hypothetical protein HQL58_11945 [Magnetococcales bacterium]|nr:hypothetical protein [Magnetococcales bacterium]
MQAIDSDEVQHLLLSSFSAYQYLTKYGFDDGHDVLPEEESICCREAHKLADVLKEHLLEWEPVVTETMGHNPYYVTFQHAYTGEYTSFYSMDTRDQRKISKLIDQLI